MALTIFNAVQPVEAAAPTTGLLASAVRPRGESEADWANGFAWRTERCPSWQTFDPCATLDTEPGPSGNGIEYHRPVGYRVADECTTLNGELDSAAVVRQAEAIAPFVIARELWDGVRTQANPYDTRDENDRTNNYLARDTATVVGTGPYPIEQALAMLEEAARQDAGGQQVTIHMPVRATPAQGLDKVGNLLYTHTGALVIADPGYTGSSPEGEAATDTTAWMYATGPVTVRMSGVEVIDRTADTLNRATNRRKVWAWRLFAATFDPCTHFAIEVALPGAVTAP